MKNKKIFVVIGFLILFGLTFNITPTKGITRDTTISIIAEKDTYIDTGSPGANYGGVDNLYTGIDYSSDLHESYFYFNFSNKPTNYKKAEISLDIWGVSKTVYLNICLIEESWDEYNMTWLNKPTHGEHITTLLVPSSNIYKIDVTNYIEGRNNISICLYTGDYLMDDYVYITSREGYYSWAPEDAPQLIWTYPETAEITVSLEYETDTIKWFSSGSIEYVIIELYKDSTFVDTIISKTKNDGVYVWYIYGYDLGDNYRIKISDYDDARVYDYSEYFSIVSTGINGNGDGGSNDSAITFLGGLILLWIFLPIIIIVGFIAIIIVLIKKRTPKPKQLSTSPFETQPKQISTQRSEQIKEIIVFCPNCGRKIKEGESFCVNCGYEL